MRLRCPFRQGESPRYCRCPKFRTDFLAQEKRPGALRSFIERDLVRVPSLGLPATRSWPISTRRYYRDGRLWFVDCGGSHRADPQSQAHGRPNTVVRSARGRRGEMRDAGQRSDGVAVENRCFG
jgi:hypothetical protein